MAVRTRGHGLACLLAACLARPCLADTTTLGTAPEASLAQLRSALAKSSSSHRPLSQPEVFGTQSFEVLRDGKPVGSLVSGRGGLRAAADADPVESCFVSLVRPGTQPTIILTIGSGDWEAETCVGVAAVGLLPSDGAETRAGIVYRTSAPHASPVEPVVVTWSETQPLRIDAAASRRASLAGATTLKELRAALR